MTSGSDSAQHSLRKLVLALAITGFSAVALSACNTVDGAGKDIESTGEAIQDGADD
jgi:predicted small secreted protein